MSLVCILEEVNISYTFCFIFRDLLIFKCYLCTYFSKKSQIWSSEMFGSFQVKDQTRFATLSTLLLTNLKTFVTDVYCNLQQNPFKKILTPEFKGNLLLGLQASLSLQNYFLSSQHLFQGSNTVYMVTKFIFGIRPQPFNTLSAI